MDEFSCEYEFEELRINGYGDGILLYGIAELAADQEPGDFYVKNIKLGDRWIERHAHGANGFEGKLFQKIAIALYADDDAAAFYAEKYAESNGPNMDHVYDATKDRAALEEVA